MTETQNTKKILRGTVVSDAMDKTVVVKIERFVKHGKYQKFFTKSKKIHAHDEQNQYKVGDVVEIVETKPVSKNKSFTVVYS